MPSYHSIFNKKNFDKLCGIPMMPFTEKKTPILDYEKVALPLEQNPLDIIDEAIIYFRANVLFKNYMILGDSDRLLVYITVFIQKCLEAANNADTIKAKSNMKALIDDCEFIPSYKAHFMNNLISLEQKEVTPLQQYLKKLRKEVVERMNHLLYELETTKMDIKLWLGMGKKKFMGYEMISKKDSR